MKPPPPHRGTRAGLVVALSFLLASAASAADERPIVYRWLDESGISHYTTQRDRIPSEFRDAAQEVGRPASAVAPAPSLESTAPAAPIVRSPSPPSVSAPALPAPPVPPAVAAPPPSGPRITPDGEFEEPPLGSGTHAAPGPRSSAAPPAPDADVAAPPPGFVRGTAADAPSQSPPRSTAAATASVADPNAPPLDATALEERIGALEAEVERDQSALQNILSEPRSTDAPRVAEREDFREIAQRLPKLQADLKALREQRARQSGP